MSVYYDRTLSNKWFVLRRQIDLLRFPDVGTALCDGPSK